MVMASDGDSSVSPSDPRNRTPHESFLPAIPLVTSGWRHGGFEFWPRSGPIVRGETNPESIPSSRAFLPRSMLLSKRTTYGSKAALRDAMANQKKRTMSKANINGQHEFLIDRDWSAQLYQRDGRWLLRWRSNGRQHGCTLKSTSKTDAILEIRKLTEQLASGLYQKKPRSHRRESRVPEAITLDDLFERFLRAKRDERGSDTARTYASRLEHVRAFIATRSGKTTAANAALIDIEFVKQLKAFLAARLVSRNGRAAGAKTLMSPRHQGNVLELFRDCLAWAKKPTVRLLADSFLMPFDASIMPPVSQKPLVRPNPIPIDRRVAMVRNMYAWQLKTLCTSVSIPTRIEDISGALISDFDLDAATWRIGPRFGDNDFNKNRTECVIPLPPIVVDLLRLNRGDRAEGPMFLRQRPPARLPNWSSPEALQRHIFHLLATTSRCDTSTANDRKDLIRSEIQRIGGVSTDAISGEVSGLFEKVGVKARPRDLRAATSDDLKRSGAPLLELRYLTQHAVNDIMTTYASLDTEKTMQQYFNHIAPLLDAMRARARELKLLP